MATKKRKTSKTKKKARRPVTDPIQKIHSDINKITSDLDGAAMDLSDVGVAIEECYGKLTNAQTYGTKGKRLMELFDHLDEAINQIEDVVRELSVNNNNRYR